LCICGIMLDASSPFCIYFIWIQITKVNYA
jgi:hypothetical protein